MFVIFHCFYPSSRVDKTLVVSLISGPESKTVNNRWRHWLGTGQIVGYAPQNGSLHITLAAATKGE